MHSQYYTKSYFSVSPSSCCFLKTYINCHSHLLSNVCFILLLLLVVVVVVVVVVVALLVLVLLLLYYVCASEHLFDSWCLTNTIYLLLIESTRNTKLPL